MIKTVVQVGSLLSLTLLSRVVLKSRVLTKRNSQMKLKWDWERKTGLSTIVMDVDSVSVEEEEPQPSTSGVEVVKDDLQRELEADLEEPKD